jgi:hypothetical protein
VYLQRPNFVKDLSVDGGLINNEKADPRNQKATLRAKLYSWSNPTCSRSSKCPCPRNMAGHPGIISYLPRSLNVMFGSRIYLPVPRNVSFNPRIMSAVPQKLTNIAID